MNPKFSIAIPAFNRVGYLTQAIQSVLTQTVSDWEVVVSDDCSADDLGAVVSSFNDRRITHHLSTDRLGCVKNHQRAVKLSSGKYVIALNSDDLMLPNCLERAGKILDQNLKMGAVYFSVTYLRDGRTQGCQHMPIIPYADAEVLCTNSWLEQYVGVTPSCCLFRRDAFERVGGYRTSLRFAHDWDFYIRMMRSGGGVLFCPEILGIYRQHEEQSVVQSTINGFRDMLDLWVLPENQHWSSALRADQLLTESRILRIRGESGWLPLKEVLDRKLFWRMARGMPKAVLDRIVRRLRPNKGKSDRNYLIPVNLEEAVAVANSLYGSTRLENEGQLK